MSVGTGGPFAEDLLDGFRSQPGATHLGATVMRIRGLIVPTPIDAGAVVGGVIGFRIDSWNEVITDLSLSPTEQPDEDWMGWLPWHLSFGTVPENATWNPEASPFAVDIKANRKLEELNQTLWMCLTAPASGSISYAYNLSIGMKLA